MDTDTIVLLVTGLTAVLGVIWHQQQSTDKLREETAESYKSLREEMAESNKSLREELREEMAESNKSLREEMAESYKSLREEQIRSVDDLTRTDRELLAAVIENGRSLARIQGFLGIGISADVASRAAGARMFDEGATSAGSVAGS